MSGEELTSEFLLRMVLSWYANPLNWASQTSYGPYSAAASSATTRDRGSSASRAVSAPGVGGLLLVVLDLTGGHVNDLAKRAGMSVTRLAEIVRENPMTPEESRALRSGIESMTR